MCNKTPLLKKNKKKHLISHDMALLSKTDCANETQVEIHITTLRMQLKESQY